VSCLPGPNLAEIRQLSRCPAWERDFQAFFEMRSRDSLTHSVCLTLSRSFLSTPSDSGIGGTGGRRLENSGDGVRLGFSRPGKGGTRVTVIATGSSPQHN